MAQKVAIIEVFSYLCNA